MYSQPMDEGWKVSFVRKPLAHSWEQKLFANMDRKQKKKKSHMYMPRLCVIQVTFYFQNYREAG